MPLGETHFLRWIELFKQTINENFNGEKALEAKARASNMAKMFHYKINHFQKQQKEQSNLAIK
jgi:hemoglobin